MSDDGITGDGCAAYGCPMLGSFGVSGKWYCVCHFRVDAGARDAVTAVLNQHRNLVDHALLMRRTFAGWGAIKEAEDVLIDLTHEVGKQHTIPTAGVVGPTHAEPAYTETDV